MAFQLISSAFPEGGMIPRLHTCDGADLSPSLEWSGVPAETRSLALIMDDPDAPGGVWNHWLLYDLSPSVSALAQGYKTGSLGKSGKNDFGRLGYGGPCPPRGHGAHRYYFRLYAVLVPSLGLPEGARRADLDRALRGQVIGETQYLGRYERK
jgi:Raf kinase inhibitor-like YbhB/YbcL family protein